MKDKEEKIVLFCINCNREIPHTVSELTGSVQAATAKPIAGISWEDDTIPLHLWEECGTRPIVMPC